MRFSIIIPTLNEAAVIEPTLQAIQTLRDRSEIIVVDGGSDDDTRQIAALSVDRVFACAAGRARQMNLGAQHARGDVLIFLHADTLIPNHALQAIDKALQNKSWGRFDIILTGQHFMFPVISQMMNWRSCLTAIATGDQVMFCNAALFHAVGGFPEIALMEDIALSRLLKQQGRPACLADKVISSGRRWEKQGVFRTILLMWSIQLRYYLGQKPERLARLYQEGKFFG